MKKFTLLSLFLLGAFFVKAQTTVLEVVAPAGSYFWNQAAGISVSWTLGEPVTATFINESAGIMLTQGFQQGNLFGTTVPENPLGTFNIQMYPNPAKSETNIKVTLPSLAKVSIIVFDITGRNVIMETLEPSSTEHTFSLNVSSLKSGIYLVRVNAGGKQQKVMKLIKE